MTRHYTVKGGDSLSLIAQREMGNALLWPSIYAANKQAMDAEFERARPTLRRYARAAHAIHHPYDYVVPGQVLCIPADAP